MPGELTLEQLLMGQTQDPPVAEPEETADEQNNEPAEEELNVNDLLSNNTNNDPGNEDNEDDSEDISEPPASSTPKEPTETDESSEEVPFPLAFARYQLDQGVLTSLTEDDEKEILEIYKDKGDAAALSFVQNKELERARNEILETYDDDVKYYLDMLDSGVDRDTAKNIVKAKSYYDKLKEDELDSDDAETTRKEVLTQYYKLTTKFSDAKIKKEVENKIALGEDIEAAKEALPEIKDYFKQAAEQEKNTIKQREEEAIKQSQLRLEELNKRIESTNEIVPNIKLSKIDKNKIKDMLTKPVKEVNGVQLNAVWAKRMEDPDKFDTMIAALINYGVFDGKWDKIVKTTKSKAVEELERSIKNGGMNFNTKPSRPKTTNTESTSSLEGLKSAFGDFNR